MVETMSFPNAKYMTSTNVSSLYRFLMNTEEDLIVLRTSRVSGGWDDHQYAARAAGFTITRFFDKELEEKHEFCECYLLTRKGKRV